MGPGEFCIRGGLVDLFPTGSSVPYRLDLLGDEIESIRTFDVDNQRSIYPVSEVRMLPAPEFPLDEEGRTLFRQRFRERFEGDPSRSRTYKDVSNGIAPAGWKRTCRSSSNRPPRSSTTLPAETRVVIHGDVPEAAEGFWRDLKSRYDLLHGDRDRPLLEPREVYVPVEDLFVALKAFPKLEIDTRLEARPLPAIEVDRRSVEPLKLLKRFVELQVAR
jgi:transcription-repair coupling factor (superfamily II helicase)